MRSCLPSFLLLPAVALAQPQPVVALQPANGRLDFPAAQHVDADGKALTCRGRWLPQFRLLLKKQ